MRTLIFAALVALALSAASDYDKCASCAGAGYEWADNSCRDYSGGGKSTPSNCDYYGYEYCGPTSSGNYIIYFGEATDPITYSISNNYVCWDYYYCAPVMNEGDTLDDIEYDEDADLTDFVYTCIVTLDSSSEVWTYAWTTGGTFPYGEPDTITSLMDGDSLTWTYEYTSTSAYLTIIFVS